jgi:DNA-binding transcriptional LysR family regulator
LGVEWLRAMRMFASVVQHGSLSAAGRQLGLSPASVSRHISALEEELHGRLINRTSRKLTLTEAGRAYFAEVSQILHRVNEANESVAQFHATPRGTLKVHSRLLVGHQFIVPALPRFLASYPDIRIDLQMSNFPIDLVEHDIDVDVRIGKLADSSLVARKLISSERYVCAATSYLERHPDIARPEDLARQNCLAYLLNSGRTVWHFRGPDGSQVEVPITGSLQSDNGLALLASVRAGVGIGLMPDWAIGGDIASGRLRRLFPEWRASHAEFDNGVYAVYQKSRHVTGKLRVFLDFLASLFREPGVPPDC